MEEIICARCEKRKTIYNEKEFTQHRPPSVEEAMDLCGICVTEIDGMPYDVKRPLSITSAERVAEWVTQKDLENKRKS